MEMTKSDILVCGSCHSVFHFVELFVDHKNDGCSGESSFKDNVSFFLLLICTKLA